MGVTRARVVVLGVIAAVLALLAGRIFDRLQPELLLAAVLPTVATLVVARRRWWFLLAVLIATTVASVVAVVLLAGGSLPGSAIDAAVRGPSRLLSTDWPSPDRPDLIGVVALGLGIATSAAAALAVQARLHLAPLAPVVAVFALIGALSAPAGPPLWWLLALGPLVAVFTLLNPESQVPERFATLASARQAAVLGVTTIVLAAGLTLPVALADRADPRRDESPATPEPLVDPIQATAALRQIDPPIEMYRIRLDEPADASLVRWRTSALGAYDGQRWLPALTLRPIGRRLSPDPDAPTVRYEAEFVDAESSLLPLPGAPVVVEAQIETDPTRTVVRLTERPTTGTTVEVQAVAPISLADVSPGEIATRSVDDIALGFTDRAQALGGSGTVIDQLTAIETALSDEYALDEDAPGGGLQRALVERFLDETERGNRAQFVTAFVLLARARGIDARVAAGFEVSAEDLGRGEVVLRSDHATVWPEVHVIGEGWVAFDPVPENETPEPDEAPEQQQTEAPAAPQPPIPPQPRPDEDPVDEEDEQETEEADEGWSTATLWAVRIGGGVAAIVLPIVLAGVLILFVKWRRRRRRLRAPTAPARITGAWAVATDRLVDAGLSIEPAWTDGEIADAAGPLVGSATGELGRLATMSSAATYGPPSDALTIERAVPGTLAEIERSLATGLTRRQRLRRRLSLRSLRRSTRSPVLGDVRRSRARRRRARRRRR